jgi:hypothetical protein
MRGCPRLLFIVLGSAVVPGCSANDDIPAPQLAGVVPDHAAVGSIVVIDGSYLCQEPSPAPDDPMFACSSDGTIAFDQAFASATTGWTDTGVMVEVPLVASGPVEIIASHAGKTSNAVSFTID